MHELGNRRIDYFMRASLLIYNSFNCVTVTKANF